MQLNGDTYAQRTSSSHPHPPYTFNALVAEVKKKPFADAKVDAVRTSLVGGGRITSEQVALLVKLIPFSGEQLEVATLAYAYAIDKANYGRVVGGAFTHPSAKDELIAFMHNQSPAQMQGPQNPPAQQQYSYNNAPHHQPYYSSPRNAEAERIELDSYRQTLSTASQIHGQQAMTSDALASHMTNRFMQPD